MLLEYGCHSNSMVSAGFTRLKFASDFGIIVSIFFQRRSLSRSDNHVSTPEFRNYAAHAAHGPSRVKSRVQPCSSAAVQHAAKYQFQRPGFWSFSQQRHATAGQLSSSCSWVLDVDVFLF